MTTTDLSSKLPIKRAWRDSLAVLVFCLLWVLFWYRDTALAMAGIWYRSETFNHGFVVFPIALWLIWQRRSHLARLAPKASPWVWPIIAAVGFGWLLGDLAGVNALAQLTLVSLMVLVVPAVLGWPVARSIAFPLAFMFFAVPIGEFAMPTLMDWTAKFTVFALRLTGIPVYQEGLQFVIPSGNWSVVEACSGVRYLIASVCVGTLFAYLNYVSLRRRLLFIGVSILVPVFANWVRAYLIVMLGHLSDGKLATGVDHLIYGWLFFGVVIMIMFVIGARWAEPELPPPVAVSEQAGEGEPINAGILWGGAVALAVILFAPHGALRAIESAGQGGPPQISELAAIPGWGSSAPPASWRPAYQNPSAELARSFEQNGRSVGLHIVYYRHQDYATKLVSSVNEIVTTKDPSWSKVAERRRNVSLADKAIEIRVAELRGVSSPRIEVWSWYWVNGKLTSSDYVAKLYTVIARLTGQGDDSAAVFVYTIKETPGSEEAMAAFIRDAAGPIEAALLTTRDRR